MLKSDRYNQTPLSSHITESDEGGLNIGQVGAAIRRRCLLIAGVTGVVAVAAVYRAKQEPPTYIGTFEVLTKPVTGESKAIANIPQTLGSQDVVAPPESIKELQTTIKVLESQQILNPVVKILQAKYPGKEKDLNYDAILKNLSITATQLNILEVQYANRDKKLVQDVLKEVADAYLKYSLAERRGDVELAISFVNQQIQPLKKRVENKQEELRILRQKYDFLEPAQKNQEVSSQIATLTQQRVENRVELEQMTAKYEGLLQELAQAPGERGSNSILTENVRYQKTLDQLQLVDFEIKKQSAVFTNEAPQIKNLYENKASLLPFIQAEEERVKKDFYSRIQELQARDNSLLLKIEQFTKYLRNLALVNRDYDNIQRELKIATEALNQFTTKQQALEI
jgi:uncharacterized protein involved in exopolysaccharide biosynthesis